MIRRELTIYYDGICPLCRREIALYRRLCVADRLPWGPWKETKV